MNNDQLTPDQRLRLEALNQAVVRAASTPVVVETKHILKQAKQFADFIADGSIGKVKPDE